MLIHGFAEWGCNVVDHLRGMFAIALWDRATQSLMLVRDRFGKKPLYWAQVGDALVFGSEIKAILAWPGVDRRAESRRHRRLSQSAICPGSTYRLCQY